jgi:hypothetical protein
MTPVFLGNHLALSYRVRSLNTDVLAFSEVGSTPRPGPPVRS